ncbi:hypothetical protein F7725_014198 [Dissostichus mawsoni]|uniref:FGF n=1 Tax=Dissostichus mawsoni TaxID=36200 RepID=A0A7J5YVN1_DISMA|nr:hypothetical protein F7725_014198 [Dissostichus mawsoni]
MFCFQNKYFSGLSSFLLIVRLHFCLSFYLTDSNPILSFDIQVREVHLYTGIYTTTDLMSILMKCCCSFIPYANFFLSFLFHDVDNHRRGMYLQMTLDGRVSGSDAQTPHKLKSVKTGEIVIKGQSSSLFLCMDSESHLRGQVSKKDYVPQETPWFCSSMMVNICCVFQGLYSEDDCTFRELLLADGYTRFISSHHGFPVSLAPRHSPDRHTVFTRFLPLRNTLARESVPEQTPDNQRRFNMDSEDLLGMGLNAMVSPQFTLDQ